MKVVQYFKHARNLNAYKKKYKRLHMLYYVSLSYVPPLY